MLRSVLACLVLAASSVPVVAQDLSHLVSARILPGWKTAEGTRMLAVQISLADGWKTYWRSPGDAGIPPEFDWSGSSNIGAVRFHWPIPDVFQTNGMETIGYHHQLVLPIEVTPRDPSRPLHVQAEVDMGVCSDVCVPASVQLAADLSGAGADDPAIRAALADQPVRQHVPATCTISPIEDGLRVTARLSLPPQGQHETVVLEPADPTIWVSPAEVTRDDGTLIATSDFVSPAGGPFALDRSALRVTVLGRGRAVETVGCPAG
ncbi:protein-disulfide reductase DsbD domain-containing protein [Falsirhodobacter algicola]|uniref:Thiol:disulfide interchange protein DsbD N-terminal domain-containing protein n=1 Tax=Falsirhodobacter algicola TaxID=2692330 RepID=A0A8J8SLM7_9RHOB|nr:protein-disulfide reductase DsbD domain-containing protein [Falsirhodobacter algicola]QUS36642.1 hypothetical protein GR316_10425 [Falsirhodobacter algicola]